MVFSQTSNLSLGVLNSFFEDAIEYGFKYIAVKVSTGGDMDEVIINSHHNFKQKQRYYNLAYDNCLDHKHANDIRITGIAYGDSFDEIEKVFEF